jgi:hypothetical protein
VPEVYEDNVPKTSSKKMTDITDEEVMVPEVCEDNVPEGVL